MNHCLLETLTRAYKNKSMWVIRLRGDCTVSEVHQFTSQIVNLSQKAANLQEENTRLRLEFDNLYRNTHDYRASKARKAKRLAV